MGQMSVTLDKIDVGDVVILDKICKEDAFFNSEEQHKLENWIYTVESTPHRVFKSEDSGISVVLKPMFSLGGWGGPHNRDYVFASIKITKF